MKQGLALRVSQHLALTPQLQQSIRLLQLSTLELGQEVQQMLDENPFLDVQGEDAGEEFGIAASDQRAAADEPETGFEGSIGPIETTSSSTSSSTTTTNESEAEPADFGGDENAPNWEGDGSTETVPDDG